MLDKLDTAIAYARTLGAQHGRSAATWVTITDEATARAILAGLDDCDPAILDNLPSPDLSGQWSDVITGPQLVEDAMDAGGIHPDASEREDWFTDICDAYDAAFTEATEAEVTRACRAILEDAPVTCAECGADDIAYLPHQPGCTR